MFGLGEQRSANLSGQVESFTGWDELDTNNFYSQASKQTTEKRKTTFDPTHPQGNWHDLNEFFEYATEWEPSASLYFGDNILQVQSFNQVFVFCGYFKIISPGHFGSKQVHKKL